MGKKKPHKPLLEPKPLVPKIRVENPKLPFWARKNMELVALKKIMDPTNQKQSHV